MASPPTPDDPWAPWQTCKLAICVLYLSVGGIGTVVHIAATVFYVRWRRRFPISEQRPRQALLMSWAANLWVLWYMMRWFVELSPKMGLDWFPDPGIQNANSRNYSVFISMPMFFFRSLVAFVFIVRCLRLVVDHYRTNSLLSGGMGVSEMDSAIDSKSTTTARLTLETSRQSLSKPGGSKNDLIREDYPFSMEAPTFGTVPLANKLPRKMRVMKFLAGYGGILAFCVYIAIGISVIAAVTPWAPPYESGNFFDADTAELALNILLSVFLLTGVALYTNISIARTSLFADTTSTTTQVRLLSMWLCAWAIASIIATCIGRKLSIVNPAKNDVALYVSQQLPVVVIFRSVPLMVFLASMSILILWPLLLTQKHARTYSAALSGLGDRDVGLREILEDKRKRQAFRLFLAGELAVENLYFWEAVEGYRSNVLGGRLVGQRAVDVARTVYDTYIKPTGALYQVNLPSSTVNQVRVALDERSPQIDFSDNSRSAAAPSTRLNRSNTNQSTQSALTLHSDSSAQSFATSSTGQLLQKQPTGASVSSDPLQSSNSTYSSRFGFPKSGRNGVAPSSSVGPRAEDEMLATIFDEAQKQIFKLMRTDSYPRFLASQRGERDTATIRV